MLGGGGGDMSELQWGHNFFVMEIKNVGNLATLSMISFNGAITFSLWKFSLADSVINSQLLLQWGHNFFVMEIWAAIVRRSPRLAAWESFNGAITFSLWKSADTAQLPLG